MARPSLSLPLAALAALALLVACGGRTELGGGDGGPVDPTPPCGAGFSCPPPGTWYDCMPPTPPDLSAVCDETACHDFIAASCTGVGFAY